MEDDSGSPQSQTQKAETLYALVSGPLASSATKLSSHSRGIPFDKDFHFYNNFDQFRAPAREIAEKSEALLRSIGSSALLRGKQHQQHPSALPGDLDDAYDWLVNLNDEVLERFGISMDEFKNLRAREEENGGKVGLLGVDDGFQLVYGKRKKKNVAASDREGEERHLETDSYVKVASRDKKTMAPRSRVPFHIPTIPRPQDEFNILVNNSNQPFEHVWLERSEDESRFVQPLEKLSVYDFVAKNNAEDEPVKPLPIENIPFKYVEGVKELKELAAKLRNVNEFAVDLEHNQYRSFQGLTCLMQISTRTEDFVVDTLKLRIHVGPHLREVFKDPSKRKVMHGADRDILWLQRDFGIYVCNMFDTGQASRVLQLERNSLEYLLHHFCGVTANKEYQNADWRLRPLPDEMIKYAREDTHYLLYMFDLMRCRLLSASSESENSDALLVEVYKRSYDICMQLYEKELLTATSYLHIYGLHEADFNSQQLAVVAGLCEWRDNVARAEDESTGYILPNKALLEIARQMPLSSAKLRRLVNARHPFVEHHLNSLVDIIRSSVENSGAFEDVAEQLKKGWEETAPELNPDSSGIVPKALPAIEGGTAIPQETMEDISTVKMGVIYDGLRTATNGYGSDQALFVRQSWQKEMLPSTASSERDTGLTARAGEIKDGSSLLSQKPVNVVSVQMSKKPYGAFGALLGNSSSKRKFDPDPKRKSAGQDKVEVKIEQSNSSMTLPFHSFSGGDIAIKHPLKPIKSEDPESLHCSLNEPARTTTELEEVIPLTNESEDSDSSTGRPMADDDDSKHRGPENGTTECFASETNIKEEPVSLSNLSLSFQKCFQSVNEARSSNQNQRAAQEERPNFFQFQPFDYSATRKQISFGDDGKEEKDEADGDGSSRRTDSREKRRVSSGIGRLLVEERGKDSQKQQQPRRRQAFPPSGNRSATFR